MFSRLQGCLALSSLLLTSAANCRAGDTDLEGHCVTLLEPIYGLDYTYTDAVSTCRAWGPGYTLAKIENQYMNDAFSTLAGEGKWDLAWIGASCHQVTAPNGNSMNAWLWNSDQSLVIDGYTNFDFGIDPNTCNAGECISMGGTGYFGKWHVEQCASKLHNAICSDDYSSDAPTPAPIADLTCEDGWTLFDAQKQPQPNIVAPSKCYRAAAALGGDQYSWSDAQSVCAKQGATLAKIEDVSTNQWLNGQSMGVGAYDIAWIGAHCVAGADGVGRYRWIKDNTLVAAGYTNFDRDIFPSITNCSLSSCVSMGGAGYSYGWRLSDCSDGLGDAFCEKIPMNGYDDSAHPDDDGPSGSKSSNAGKVAAGVLVPLLLVGIVGAIYHRKQQGNDAFGMGTKFISTGAYSAGAVDDGTNFHAVEEGRGAASL